MLKTNIFLEQGYVRRLKTNFSSEQGYFWSKCYFRCLAKLLFTYRFNYIAQYNIYRGIYFKQKRFGKIWCSARYKNIMKCICTGHAEWSLCYTKVLTTSFLFCSKQCTRYASRSKRLIVTHLSSSLMRITRPS